MDYRFSDRVQGLKPSAIREIFKYAADPSYISLSAGNPSEEAFPVREITEISQGIFKHHFVDALQYSITEGYAPLRDAIKEHMQQKHNSKNDNDAVLITSGAQQAIDLFSKALLNEGDVVLCEAPSFIGSLNDFRSYNARLVGIPMEDDGIDLNALELALKQEKNIKFLYTIPNFQNPSGITMSLEKRKALYELAKKYRLLILEDNPYGELYYSGKPLPDIKAFDDEGLVVYVGSFSKVISPGMRVGWCLADKEIIQKMTVCKQGQDVHTNIWSQLVIYEFMTKYDFEGHLERLRKFYAQKAEFTQSLLDEHLSAYMKYGRIDGGLFVWCTLPENVNMNEFCKALLDKKVCVVLGNAFMVNENDNCNSFRINFSTPSREQLECGIEIIGKVASEFMKRG